MTKKRQTKKRQNAANKGEMPPVDITPIVKEVQLCHLRLRKSASVLGVITNNPPELRQAITIETGLNEADPKEFLVQATFTLVGQNPDDQEALHIEATFEILYKSDVLAEITPEQMNAFGQLIGVNNAWPYWREFVQSTTTRMGLPAITMPLLRLSPTPPVTAQSKKAAKPRKKRHAVTKKKK